MAKNKAKMNKFLTGAITATMVATAVAPVASAASFTDLDNVGANVKAEIDKAVELGFFKEANKFNPAGTINRSQAALTLARYIAGGSANTAALKAYVQANELDTEVGVAPFQDVPVSYKNGNSHQEELYYAAVIVKDAGAFTQENLNPTGPVTRSQMAKIITGAFGLNKAADFESKITDINHLDAETKEFIETIASHGVTNVTTFNPAGTVTRSQMASFLVRANDAVQEDVEVEPKVESVSAINGTVTVTFNEAPDAVPAVTDFKVTQNINGKTTAINASSVQWDAATKTAKLAVPTIYATEADQNVSYSVGYKETAAKSSASFQVAKVTEVKVDSVTALNSKQIQVVFNQEMDKTSVQTLANYEVSADPDAATPPGPDYKAFADLVPATGTKAVLQDDKKTVIITLGTAEEATDKFTTPGIIDNKHAYALKVKNAVVKSTSGKVLEKDAELAFKLNDTQAPTVSKVEVNELGGLDVTFNEQVDSTKGKITVNGFTYDISGADVTVTNANGVSKATIKKDDLIAATKAKLELGKSYTIAVSEQEDAYGEKATSVFSSSFTYVVNAVAPVLKSVTAEDEKSFILEFNKPVTQVDPAGSLTVQVNKGAKQLKSTATTHLGGGKYLVELTHADDIALDVIYDRAKNETSTNLTVYIPAIKDAAGNITAAGNTTVTLSKDVTKPAVEKAVSTGSQLDVTLTEEVKQIANLAPGAYVLAENGRQIPVKTADFSGALIAGDAKEFSFVYESDNSKAEYLAEGNYTLVIKKDTLTDLSLNNGNKNDEIRIPFAVGAGLQVKPEVVGTVDATATAGELVVNFSAPVTYQSVANYTNYKVDGIAIPSASTFTLDAAGTKLTIKLPEATYKDTKDRVVSISGARNLAGTVMAEYQAVTKVSENEEIKLQSAKVVGDDVILTFNENVDATTLTGGSANPFVIGDFIVKANGVSVAVADVKVEDSVTVNDPTKVAKNQLKISAVNPTDVNFTTGTITVEVKDGAAAKDVAGNKATPVIVTANR